MLKKCLLLLLSVIAFTAFSQEKTRNIRKEIAWMKKALTQFHVEPKAIDDAFSSALFDHLLEDLDPDRIFFTADDIAWLEPYRNLLDDDINGKDTGFLNRLSERYRSGVARSERLIHAVLGASIDWRKNDVYTAATEWAADEQALAARYRQWLKYEILDRLTDLLDRDSVVQDGFFEKNLPGATDYVLLTTLRPITRLLKDAVVYDHELTNTFLKAMAHVFDPHSDFLSVDAFDDFKGSLSTEDYFFGFTLGEDAEGNTIISALAPGGAAWKSGELHVSDIVLAIQWPGEEQIDLAGMSIEDVNTVLEMHDADVIQMTIRSVEGNENQVTLRKERLAAEQNVVQSFILNGKVKTGYIYLPDFYTHWGDEQEGGRCANDVAKEIIKLKKEGIDGLILDLRFNGGGSLYEAQAMAGIFIDEGPLVVISTREQKGITLKDMNRGTIYDGPLVLMVNGASASASEVLAATIQDYNRGLIVGSKTYGKATGQNLFPLGMTDTEKPLKKKPTDDNGFVKITTQRLYRVTGKSAQSRGVTPDVTLPDIFATLDLHESKQPFVMPQDSIAKNTYYKPMKPMDRELVQKRSQERILQRPEFQDLRAALVSLEAEMSKPQSLLWEEYLDASVAKKNKRLDAKKKVESPEVVYEVSNSLTKEERLKLDDYARTINERWSKILAADIYLQETFHILSDYIETTKKF